MQLCSFATCSICWDLGTSAISVWHNWTCKEALNGVLNLGNHQCFPLSYGLYRFGMWKNSEQGDTGMTPNCLPEYISTILNWLCFADSISFTYRFLFFPILTLLLKLIFKTPWKVLLQCFFIVWFEKYIYLFIGFSWMKWSCFSIYIHWLLMFSLAKLMYSLYICCAILQLKGMTFCYFLMGKIS